MMNDKAKRVTNVTGKRRGRGCLIVGALGVALACGVVLMPDRVRFDSELPVMRTPATAQPSAMPARDDHSAAFAEVAGVESVGLAAVMGDVVSVQVCVESIDEAVADALRSVAYQVTGRAAIEFSALLDDGERVEDWVWDNVSDQWRVTVVESVGSGC